MTLHPLMCSFSTASALALLALSIPASHAAAQDEVPATDAEEAPYPVAHAARPLNLPQGHFRVTATLVLDRSDNYSRPYYGRDPVLSLNVGGAVGIADRFELGVAGERLGMRHFVARSTRPPAGLLAATLAPDLRYGTVPVYARFGLVKTKPFDLSLDAGLSVPTNRGVNSDDYEDLEVFHALVARGRVNERLTIDSGLEIAVRVPFDSVAESDLWVPLSFLIQARENLFFALRTGVMWRDFDELVAPVGVEVGYTVRHGERPVADLTLGWGLPAAITRDDGALDVWQVTLGAQLYFAL